MESTDHVGVRRYQVCLLTPSNLEVRAHRSYQGDFKIQNGDAKVQAECKIFSKSADRCSDPGTVCITTVQNSSGMKITDVGLRYLEWELDAHIRSFQSTQ